MAQLPARGRDSAPPVDVSLYRGVTGAAIALLDAAELLGVGHYRSHAVDLLDQIRRSARAEGDGATWSPANDVLFGDAGTAVALFAAGQRLADTGLQNLAVAAGRTLLRRSKPDSGGLNWLRSERPPLFFLPNFSHGAAGIGTVLAMLGRAPGGAAEFRAAGVGASRFLLTIARRGPGALRIPYGWPVPDGGWARPFDASWAHGQAGSARLFWELWRSSRDSSYLSLVLESVGGLDAAGLLESPSPGYGTERLGVNYRFGLSGVADFFADLYDETGDRQYLDRAVRLANAILSRADSSPNRAGWTVLRPGFMPHAGEPALFTGLLHGAAGPGLLFLKLDALLSGRRPPGSLPDNPFGEW